MLSTVCRGDSAVNDWLRMFKGLELISSIDKED